VKISLRNNKNSYYNRIIPVIRSKPYFWISLSLMCPILAMGEIMLGIELGTDFMKGGNILDASLGALVMIVSLWGAYIVLDFVSDILKR
jgi:hypothetical protein